MEELMNRLTPELMQELKLTSDKEGSVRRYLKRAASQVMIYCNREDIPSLLEDTVAQIAEDMLKADGVISISEEVASITRGDTSIGYRDKSSAYQSTVGFTKNYEQLLNRYRKIKLPEGR